MKNGSNYCRFPSLGPLFLALLLLVFLPACGSTQKGTGVGSGSTSPATGAVSFSVEWDLPPSYASSEAGILSARPMAPTINVCTDYGIDTVTMKVLSGNNVIASAGYPCAQHGGTLNNVPAGSNLVLRLEASVPGQGTVWVGDTSFSLAAGQTKDVGKVSMSYTGTDTTPPTVLSVTPDNNAAHVPDSAAIRIVFSERMSINTVQDNASITVVDNLSRPIPGSIVYSASDNSATFAPSSLLPQGMKYTVTVGASVADMADRRIAAPFQWSFAVHAQGTWGDPVPLENINFGADLQHIAMDNAGRATVLWVQNHADVGYLYDLWSNRYIPGTGWEGPVLMENAPGTIGPASQDFGKAARIAVQDDGTAGAIWWQHTEAPYLDYRGSIFATRFSPATGWEAPSLLETGTGPASNPRIAMSFGNITTVWIQQVGLTTFQYALWTKNYSSFTGWGSEVKLATVSGFVPVQLVPGLVAWAQDNGVWAIIGLETPGTPVAVSTGTGSCDALQMAGNGESAIAVWMQNSTVIANRYVSGQGWGTPVTLSGVLSAGGRPQIAVDASGDAIVVWPENGSVWFSRYLSGQGWGAPATLGNTTSGASIAMNGGGTAIVLWTDQNFKLVSRRYVPGQGWGTALVIPATDGVSDFQVAIDGGGNTIALWDDFGGNVWAARNY